MEWPQIVTTISDKLSPISTVVDAPWVSVTSINGMTGDVVVEPILSAFQPNHYYIKGTAVTYEGALYYAKTDFTSSTTFNLSDWDIPQFTQEQADWNENSTTAKSYIKNKPVLFSGNYEDLQNLPNLAEVALSGDYADLTNLPNLARVATSGLYSDLTGAPVLARVATTGNYADLNNKPSGVLTILQNNTSLGTFNGQTSKSINISTPTAVSQLTNDSEYITSKNRATWSTFVFTGDAPDTYELTTLKGNPITIRVINGGTGAFILAGGSGITIMRCTARALFSPSLSNAWGLYGLSNGTNIYTRKYSGANSGAWASNVEGVFAVESSGHEYCYGTILQSNGPRSSIGYTYTAIRATGNGWRLLGKIGAAGTLDTATFDIEATATNSETIPGIYQRGATTSNTSLYYLCLEILEQ